jgi:hypothetical protein
MGIDVTPDGRWTIQRVVVRDWPRTTTPSKPQLGLGALAALGFAGELHRAHNRYVSSADESLA